MCRSITTSCKFVQSSPKGAILQLPSIESKRVRPVTMSSTQSTVSSQNRIWKTGIITMMQLTVMAMNVKALITICTKVSMRIEMDFTTKKKVRKRLHVIIIAITWIQLNSYLTPGLMTNCSGFIVRNMPQQIVFDIAFAKSKMAHLSKGNWKSENELNMNWPMTVVRQANDVIWPTVVYVSKILAFSTKISISSSSDLSKY